MVRNAANTAEMRVGIFIMSSVNGEKHLSRKAEMRKREILKAAVESYGERGSANATLQEIADKVGMIRAGILHYFGSKENLLIEAIKFRDDEGKSGYPAGEIPSGRVFFRHLIDTAHENSMRWGIVRAYTTLSSESVTDDNPGQEYFCERYQKLREKIAESFTIELERDLFLDDSWNEITVQRAIDLATASIPAVMDGLQLQWLLDPSEVDLSDATEFAVKALVDAVKKVAKKAFESTY